MSDQERFCAMLTAAATAWLESERTPPKTDQAPLSAMQQFCAMLTAASIPWRDHVSYGRFRHMVLDGGNGAMVVFIFHASDGSLEDFNIIKEAY